MEEEVFKEVEVGTTCNLRPCLAFYAAFLSVCVCVCVCVLYRLCYNFFIEAVSDARRL